MNIFRAGLSLGASKHWSEALKKMTGETELDASAILEYFSPLYKYLVKENSMSEAELSEVLDTDYNQQMGKAQHKSFLASWATETDLGNAQKEDAEVY